jgi:hypothetical protein
MTQSPLARLAGPIALSAGALICLAQVGMFATLDTYDRRMALANPWFVGSMVVFFAALSLLLLALVATYEAQAHRAGRFGLVAFGAAFAGTIFLAGNHWFDTFAGPWIADTAPELLSTPVDHPLLTTAAVLSYALFAAGWVFYGVASMRAHVYPMAISVAVVVGGAIGFLALSAPFGIPIGLAVGTLGFWVMFRRSSTSVALQAPAS